MANITFDVLQTQGHLNPSFKLAKELQKKGHKINYTSGDRYKEFIEKQGFSVTNVYRAVTPILNPNKKVHKKYSKILTYLIKNTIGRLFLGYLQEVTQYASEQRLIMNRIKEILNLKPDLVIVDSMAPLYRTILYCAYDVKVIMLQTMMSPTQAPQIPPLHSRIIPRNSLLCKNLMACSWKWYYTKINLKRKWRKLIYFGSDPHSISEHVIKKCKFPKDRIDYERTINPGLKNLLEINLAPRSLDFPRKYKDYEIAVGCAVDTDRVDTLKDIRLEHLLNTCSQPIVYCSLGTISTVHNAQSSRFLRKIIKAVRNQPWEIILSIGTKVSIKDLGLIPSNVHIFDYVPQLQVLEHADLMITHGGLNSVVECVIHEVPMIVCPLNNKWDQNGNAARVLYHNIGVVYQIRHEYAAILTSKIKSILATPSIMKSISQMRNKVLSDGSYKHVVDKIDTLLVNNNKEAA